MVAAAAALLIFCFHDTNGQMKHLSSAEFQDLVNQSAPGQLRVGIWVSHYRTIFHESPEVFRSLEIDSRKDGKTTHYWAPVDDASAALLAQAGIACPTYIEGRDFEILGTPGRLLPLMAAFVLGISAIFLLKRHRTAGAKMPKSA